MNERRKIEERLRKKEEEISQFEAKLRDARIYVQALQDVLKILPRGSEKNFRAGALRPGSGMAKVRDFILEKGRPGHVTELLDALGRPATREARASLSGSLAAYVRKGEIFTRPSPNTFGLIELGYDNEDDANPESEPPAGFGEDEPPLAGSDQYASFSNPDASRETL
jgi:hypothetical protein